MYLIFPSAFHRRRVFRCASRSTRLWTCMSSMRGCLSSAIERCIWSMPFCSPRMPEPGVHTFVAMNAWPCCCGVRRSPSTASAVEYIGEVSISVAPAAKNAPRTSRSGVRAAASVPTSKGPEVPRPTAGSASPVEGILRSSILAAPSSLAADEVTPAIAATPLNVRKLLRSMASPATVTMGLDGRGVGSDHGVRALRDDALEHERPRQYLAGVEPRGRELATQDLDVRRAGGELTRRDVGGPCQEPAADHDTAELEERHGHRHGPIRRGRERAQQRRRCLAQAL